MTARDFRLGAWLKDGRHADLAALAVLLVLCAGGAALTWGRLDNPIGDLGWDMQVAARVLGGDVLYRDVIWMYGPLPVYLLSLFFRQVGTQVTTFMILLHLFGVMGALLTYRVARSLLPPGLALAGTAAVLLGGIWGGYLAYALPYTAAIPLGGVLGLAFLACLLSYLSGRGPGWLVGAGAATGAALLTKPEFALATLGTGLLILAGLCVHSGGAGRSRRTALIGTAAYGLSVVFVAGISYAVLGSRAGWLELWAGISGYDEDIILLRYWPPWGSPLAWGYIVSGLGLWLTAGALLLRIAVPELRRGWRAALAGTVLIGLTIALLPGRLSGLPGPRLLSASMRASPASFTEALVPVLWAPATSLVVAWMVALTRGWWVSWHRRQQIAPVWWSLGALVLYSGLGDARSFLNPAATFHFLFLSAFAPVLLYTAGYAVDRLARRRGLPARPRRVGAVLAAGLAIYALIGLTWDVGYLARFDTALPSRRGSVIFPAGAVRRASWMDMQAYLLSHTAEGEAIAILGYEPGFYFLNGLRNPLRQDTILPGMGASPADAQEIVRRLAAHPPRLIVLPQSVEQGGGWFWGLPEGREAYANLAPVWEWVTMHYRLQRVVGDDAWGYMIFEPADSAS